MSSTPLTAEFEKNPLRGGHTQVYQIWNSDCDTGIYWVQGGRLLIHGSQGMDGLYEHLWDQGHQ